METLREVKGIKLNKSRGLFNLSTVENISLWFNEETKEDLMEASGKDFLKLVRKILTIRSN